MHKGLNSGIGLLSFCFCLFIFFGLFLASEECLNDQNNHVAKSQKSAEISQDTEKDKISGAITIGGQRFEVKPEAPNTEDYKEERSNCEDAKRLLNFAQSISNPLIAIFTMLAVYFAVLAWRIGKADLAQTKKANVLQLQSYWSIVDFDWRWQIVGDGQRIQPNIAIKFVNKGITPVYGVERITILDARIMTPRRYKDGYLADPAHKGDYRTFCYDHVFYRNQWVVNPYSLVKFDHLAPNEMQPIMFTLILKDNGENLQPYGAVEKVFIKGSIHFYDISTGPDEIRICDFEIQDDSWDFQRWFDKFRDKIGDEKEPQRQMSRITGDQVVMRDRNYEKRRDKEYSEFMAQFDVDKPADSTD